MLPGPPPVSRCGICCSTLEHFNLLSGLMGCTPSSIQCNSGCGCTCSLLIESRAAPVSIVIAQTKEHARSLLGNRPPTPSCLLVSSRTASKLQPILKSCTLIHIFKSDTSLGLQINHLSSKPSPILVFHVPPDTRDLKVRRNSLTMTCRTTRHKPTGKNKIILHSTKTAA